MKKVLKNMTFLFFDCQATSPNPREGHLLEIGWGRSDRLTAGNRDRIACESYFVKIPNNETIPARVTKVTGITNDDLIRGISRHAVWKKLRAAAGNTARCNRMRQCPVIIHFARFERPLIEALHAEHEPSRMFPFYIICTHEIARRLYPELPRRGIKALAGYFGYRSGEQRRSCDHVQATACIWDNLVKVLAQDHSITTLADLQQWFENTPVRKFRSRGFPMKERYRRHLPDAPGVYRMCRSANDILYIGKARSLKKRVNSYFKKRGPLAGHILEMLTQARRIEVIETGSAFEAALLESDQIKQFSPPYNIALRSRARAVMYCNSTYTEFTDEPSVRHCIGPLTAQDPLRRLALLKPFLIVAGSRINRNIIQESLTLTESYGPGPDVIQEGMDLFLERNRDVLCEEPLDYALHRLGQRLWLYRGDTVIEDEGIDPSNDEAVWSSESVARAIESIIIRSVHTMRRARLCVLLSESSVVWEERTGDGGRYKFLVFSSGAIVDKGAYTRKKRAPVPPGYAKKFLERQRAFDILTIDRMRVLITELRRLVNSGTWVRVRLRPRVVLDSEKLERIFAWV